MFRLNILYVTVILTSFIITIFHLHYVKEIGFRGDANYYIEYSARLFENNFEPLMFRPFYYLYGNLAQKIFGLNDYSIKIFNIILFGINGVLTFVISKQLFKNNLISLTPTFLLFSNPGANLEATTENTTMLSTFLVLIFLLFFFYIKKKVEKKLVTYSVLFGFYAAALFFTHEELIVICAFNSLLLINYFKSKKNFIKFLTIQMTTFVGISLIFILKFANDSLIKNFISQALNVLPKNINYFIRSKYHNTDYDIQLSITNLFDYFNNDILNIFPKYFIPNYFVLLIFIVYFILILKNKKKDENLNILTLNLIIYFIVLILTIRAAPRLFISYYPIFFIIFVFAVNYIIQIVLKNNFKPIITLFLFSYIIFNNFFYLFPHKYKNEITQDKLLFNFLNDKINNTNKILLLSSIYDAGPGTGARKKIGDQFTENYSLSSKVYFGENAILFRNILRFESDVKDFLSFIKKNKIKYAIFKEEYSEKAYTKKEFENINKLFVDKKKFIEDKVINKKDSSYLKLYGSQLNELFFINSDIETQLVENFSVEKRLINLNYNDKNFLNEKVYILEFKY